MINSKTFNVAKGCIENKCKLKGLFNEKPIELNANVSMPSLTISGNNLKFEVGND